MCINNKQEVAQINSTPPSVTLKQLALDPFVPEEEEEVQWTLKTWRLLCSSAPRSEAARSGSASCLEHSRRWVTRRCQGRQRYGRSVSEEDGGPLVLLLMAWQAAKMVIL